MDADNSVKNKILSLIEPENFIGRTSEIETILNHAKQNKGNKGLLALSAPVGGLSELLLQCYDRLFLEQGDIIPVYFSFSGGDNTPENAARRFLQTFLLQVVAFRRNDLNLFKIAPDICELSELAAPTDLQWINKLISACERDSHLKDERAFIRQAFSAPLRAAGNGAQIVVFFDDFHRLENLSGETSPLDEIKEIYNRATIPFVFAGRRRSVLNAIQSGNTKLLDFETLTLNNLSDFDAGLLIENLAKNTDLKITEQTRDLIIRQFDANPFFLNSIFSAARDSGLNMESFQTVEKVYIDALFSGRIGRYYDSVFEEITANFELQKKIAALVSGTNQKTPIEAWRKRLNIAEKEFNRIMRELHVSEIIRLSSNAVEFSIENKILRDYLESRYRLETIGEQRALVIGTLLSESLKRAPQIMSRFYRRTAALGLREILAVFNHRQVPASLLDYAIYKDKYKGAEDAEILEHSEKETEKIGLPQIVYTASCAAFYPPINQFLDEERASVALGFETVNYTAENEIVWIAAEIESKLEASREMTEFWCDRLEIIALMCNFPNYRLWLVAPEGFTPEAAEVLRQRSAYGSSRRQVGFLLRYLKAEDLIKEKINQNEYEMIVPMGDDTEMIAAHAIEEIARRHHFEPKAITQMKTALVEACINAAEHSLSPDRKIYQKFKIEDDKIIITISNRGVKIPSTKVAESITKIEPDETRRGWGLKLMKTLMDEVEFEQVDDGTRISMVKYLKNTGKSK